MQPNNSKENKAKEKNTNTTKKLGFPECLALPKNLKL